MILERIIFNVLAFALFIIIFLKMIRKNDTNYIYILGAQALGIAISFFGLVIRVRLNIILMILTYFISIILPITIIICEKNGLYLSELFSLSLSKFYYKKGDLKKSKSILQNAINRFPDSFFLHKLLASIYETNNEKQIAAQEYLRASEINTNDYKLKIKTANLFVEDNKLIEAEKIANDILREKPDSYETSILLGDILYSQEKYKEAINVYLQALIYNPNDYDLYYSLGIMYTAINDFQSAKENYQKAAELNSLLYPAKYDLGQLALLYNEIDEANNYFLECINDEDILDHTYYYLSYICMLKGEKENAIDYLNNAVEDNQQLYDKALKEPVFRTIIAKINKPNNTSKERKTITYKEEKNMKHLEETCALVGQLNHNDIKVLRNIRKVEKQNMDKEDNKEKEENSKKTKKNNEKIER